ncbi:MAG: hypothetical protein CSA53_00955 [Gammaproteobacteria bacterium]|nr:MAG: hypothetical protein CSA53_00955 [Gammaproteobacteria bacterium]
MMAVALLVMMYASVELVGKALVDSERSRVSQVALSIALELEKANTDVDRLTETLATLAQTGELRFYENYNGPNEPPYFTALWYLGSKYISHGCFWTGVYTDPFTLEPMTTCARAIYRDGQFGGVASVDVSLKGVERALDKHMANVYGYAFVLDRNLRVLAKPDDKALQRQFGMDLKGTDAAFPPKLSPVTDSPAFQPVAGLITQYRDKHVVKPLSDELLQTFKDTASYYPVEQPGPISAYIQRGGVTDRELIRGTMVREPALQESAEVFLVHMPRMDSFLLIVVPRQHFLSQSRSTLYSLLGITLLAVTVGVVLLWGWLRRVLIRPLNDMVRRIDSGGEQLLDTDQKYELKALATAYNMNQRKLSASRKSLQKLCWICWSFPGIPWRALPFLFICKNRIGEKWPAGWKRCWKIKTLHSGLTCVCPAARVSVFLKSQPACHKTKMAEY